MGHQKPGDAVGRATDACRRPDDLRDQRARFIVGFLFLVGVAALALRGTDLLPTWFAWLGVPDGLVSLVSLILLLPEDGSWFGFVSLGRFPGLLWLLAAALILNGRLRRTT